MVVLVSDGNDATEEVLLQMLDGKIGTWVMKYGLLRSSTSRISVSDVAAVWQK